MKHPRIKLTIPVFLVIACFVFLPAFQLIAASSVKIASPTNSTTYIKGDTVKITADASNPGGVILGVEFYVNNVYIGTDSTAPFQQEWIGTEGTHLLTTKAIIGLCKDITSIPVQIIIKKNTAPSVHLTTPSGVPYFSNVPISLSAVATDSDGVISHVDFYVNAVLVKSDATAPYAFDWKSIPGSYTIIAKAFDNKGAQTYSLPVAITIDLAPNAPPTVAITSPLNGAHFLLGTPITIHANANDTDGPLAFVEFFANNTSIGIDYSAPYEVNWPGTAGIVTIIAKATDNVCASRADTIHISITDPNAPPYVIETISGPCTDPSFCLPVNAVLQVKDIIGYDFVLHYDKTKVHPTGHMTISNDLIHAGVVSYVSKNNDSLSEVNISVFLNNSAPVNASFQGIGQLLCVEFSKVASFTATDSAQFNITDLQESYANGVSSKQVTPGKYMNLKNTSYKGGLKFWADNSPIKYDVSNPSHYLITTIYGTDSNCSHLSAGTIQPDLNGEFTYSIINGTSMQVTRDILPVTDVQPAINGMDVTLGYDVLLNNLSYVPSVYQVIALDVNMDGIISAGDISQMNQRSIKTILEFKQKWNYTNNGNSNGQLSKDWIFIDSALLASTAYNVSTTYPSNDGIGYSKYKVPTPPFCLPVPSSVCSGCTPYTEGKLKGILVGDADGNYATLPADGEIKRMDAGKGNIYLDLTKAKNGKEYTDVPVYFSSSEKIVALDFSFKLEETLEYAKILQSASYLNDALANVDDDRILRFTSNSRKNYEVSKPIAIMRFRNSRGSVTSSELTELKGYLNGEPVLFEIRDNSTTGILHGSENKDVQVYPNPTNGILNVLVTETSTVQLLDLQGKKVIAEIQATANEKLEIHTESFKSGAYLLKVSNKNFVNTQQVVIEGK